MRRGSLSKTILAAGLTAGALDILDPIVFYYLRSHVRPARILQSVAAGLLGKAAYSGGWATTALGLGMHFCIAIFWAALFVLLSRAISALRKYAVPSGLLYGLCIYVTMNYVVLPHTHAAPAPSHMNIVFVNALCAIVFLVGLPIALINRKLS